MQLERALSVVGRASSGCPTLVRDLDQHFAEAGFGLEIISP